MIDQAEELVTGQVSGGLFRAAFIEQLAEAIREIPELQCISCQARLQGSAGRGPGRADALSMQFEIHPLAPAAALAAVREPMAATHRLSLPGSRNG